MAEYLYYLITIFIGFGVGMFIMWILTRPEPKDESKAEVCHAYNETEWNEAMKDCGLYYKQDGSIKAVDDLDFTERKPKKKRKK